MIPRKNWKYRGLEGHLIIRSRCRFRLCTDIGRYRISTVGAFYEKSDDEYMTEIGLDRHYETLVFPLKDGERGDEVIESDAIFYDKDKDDPYAKDMEAEAMHDRMCLKYATSALD